MSDLTDSIIDRFKDEQIKYGTRHALESVLTETKRRHDRKVKKMVDDNLVDLAKLTEQRQRAEKAEAALADANARAAELNLGWQKAADEAHDDIAEAERRGAEKGWDRAHGELCDNTAEGIRDWHTNPYKDGS